VATTRGLALPRQRLEDEWLARLKDAEAAWLRARQEYEVASQNGWAIDRAYQNNVDALVQYKCVLRTFTDLVVDYKIPGEEIFD